ncbi:MAG: hypothetical protein ACI3V0_11435 [Faecousia sp.]
MMLTEQVYTQAALLAGQLDAQQTELLKILCQVASRNLENRLRSGLTVEDCRADFVAAASLFALAALQEAGKSNALEELRAGDLTVKRRGMDTSSRCLQRQAELIIGPFLEDGFVFVGV